MRDGRTSLRERDWREGGGESRVEGWVLKEWQRRLARSLKDSGSEATGGIQCILGLALRKTREKTDPVRLRFNGQIWVSLFISTFFRPHVRLRPKCMYVRLKRFASIREELVIGRVCRNGYSMCAVYVC